jgi:hypothetical protein
VLPCVGLLLCAMRGEQIWGCECCPVADVVLRVVASRRKRASHPAPHDHDYARPPSPTRIGRFGPNVPSRSFANTARLDALLPSSRPCVAFLRGLRARLPSAVGRRRSSMGPRARKLLHDARQFTNSCSETLFGEVCVPAPQRVGAGSAPVAPFRGLRLRHRFEFRWKFPDVVSVTCGHFSLH